MLSLQQKQELVQRVQAQLNDELSVLSTAAKSAHEAATHEESKAEDSHDTRGLEASYLAGAHIARMDSLKNLILMFQRMTLKEFKDSDPIEIGAWVEVHLDEKPFYYLLVQQGGGVSVSFLNKTVQLITPQAPLGEALLGRFVGDTVDVEGQRVSREYEIVGIG